MNCIDEEILQKYIDGECTGNETAAVKKHLEDCPVCREKLAEMKKLSERIKRALNSLTTENRVIPEFKEPKFGSSGRTGIRYLMIGTLAAACILAFVLFITDKKSEPLQGKITIVQIAPMEVDANRTAGDQDFVIEVFDDKGQHSEYFLNN